jgi:hypothetical protein
MTFGDRFFPLAKKRAQPSSGITFSPELAASFLLLKTLKVIIVFLAQSLLEESALF